MWPLKFKVSGQGNITESYRKLLGILMICAGLPDSCPFPRIGHRAAFFHKFFGNDSKAGSE